MRRQLGPISSVNDRCNYLLQDPLERLHILLFRPEVAVSVLGWRGVLIDAPLLHGSGVMSVCMDRRNTSIRMVRREYSTASSSSGGGGRPGVAPAPKPNKVKTRTVSRTGAPVVVPPPPDAPNPATQWYASEFMRASESIDLLYWHQAPFKNFIPPPPPTVITVARHSVTSLDNVIAAAAAESDVVGIESDASGRAAGSEPRKKGGRIVLVVQESKKERKKRRGDSSTGRNVFTPQMLVPLLPSYFVPLSSLLSEFPEGYTEQHIAQLFEPTGTVEIVRMQDETYIRLHGGKHFVDVTETTRMARQKRVCPSKVTTQTRGDPSLVAKVANVEEDVLHVELAYERHEFFRPNPSLCAAFIKLLPRANRWMSLQELIVDKASPALRSALHPFTNYQSLLYFAQMQHHFNFTPQGDGEVCKVDDVTHLNTFTSPIPTAVNELICVLKTVIGEASISAPQFRSSAELEDGNQGETMDGRSVPLSDLTDTRRQPPYGLSMFSKKLIMLYFDTLENFIIAHQKVFAYSPATGLVTLRLHNSGVGASQPVHEGNRNASRQTTQSSTATPSASESGVSGVGDSRQSGVELIRKKLELLYGAEASGKDPRASSGSSSTSAHGGGLSAAQGTTLEDKLEIALARHDRLAAQKFRRHIALRDNPDSPYTDREVLMDAIMRYLPQRRSISLRFLLKMLPSSLKDFLPDSSLKLFRSFAVANMSAYSASPACGEERKPVMPSRSCAPGVTEKIVMFEFRVKNNIHVMRTGLPLPDGHLRFSYTEAELLFMCAAELREKSRRMGDVYGRLPYAAREQIRIEYKGLVELLQRYPMYFMIVFPDAVRMDSRVALVTLLKSPPTPTVPVKKAQSGSAGSNTNEQQQQQQKQQESVRKFSESDWGNIDLSPEQKKWLEDFDLESVKDLSDTERTDVQSRMTSIADSADSDLT